jgi:hypothetical protein
MELLSRIASDVPLPTMATYVFSYTVSIIANSIAKNWIKLSLALAIILLILRPLLKAWRKKKIIITKY